MNRLTNLYIITFRCYIIFLFELTKALFFEMSLRPCFIAELTEGGVYMGGGLARWLPVATVDFRSFDRSAS